MALEPLQSSRFPYLTLQVTVDERLIEIMGLIDTGFDGDLVLPPAEIDSRRMPDEYRIWALADGSETVTPIYYGNVRLATMPRLQVDIAALGDEAIIGRGITDHYRLILDHGRQVIVEP